MTNRTTTIRVRLDARQYEDEDDCLAAAALDVARDLGCEAWAVEAEWEDDQRQHIVVAVVR